MSQLAGAAIGGAAQFLQRSGGASLLVQEGETKSSGVRPLTAALSTWQKATIQDDRVYDALQEYILYL